MSKSKKNVVDPDDIIASHGADTARWFMLSDSPPDRDVIWTESGVEGAHRFVQRIWRLVPESRLCRVGARGLPQWRNAVISRCAHKTVKAVGEDITNCRPTRLSRASTKWSTIQAGGRSPKTKGRYLVRAARGNRYARRDDRSDDAASGRGMLERAWRRGFVANRPSRNSIRLWWSTTT